MELNLIQQNIIREDSVKKSPQESCGLLLNNGDVIPCENVSETPTSKFIINPNTIQEVGMDNIMGFYHSHLDNSEFSLADIYFSERCGKDCILYNISNNEFKIYQPKGYQIPYENRPFFLGYLDCFNLFLDYYKRELNLHFPNIVHKDRLDYKNWHNKTQELKDVLLNYYINNGFRIVNNLKEHDVILVKLPNIRFPIHILIYLKENNVLHHLYECSKIEPYSNSMKRLTSYILRHNSL